MDWIAFAFLMVVATADIFIIVFLVPKFRQIFSDILGTRPLPSSTSFVLEARYLFEAMAFTYLGGGILVVRLASSRIALRSVLGLILAAVIQAGFTTCALFLPLVGGLIQGINKP
jgi:type II secretory pathway component PulF